MSDRTISRREFVAASALGVVGVAVRGGRASGEGWQPGDQLLYIGGYTESGRMDGVHLVRMDVASGALRLVGSMNAGPNPSFLAIRPNGRTMYAVNELAEGGLSALAIDRITGGLTPVGQQLTHGADPCYVSLDRSGWVALVANYTSGSVALFPLNANGALAPAAVVDQHHGSGPNKERQEGPHAHCIVADPSNRFALNTDLGLDRVFVYRLDARHGALQHVESSDAQMPPGSGPRHIAFHPTLPLVFVASELASTLTTLRFDRASGKLTVIDIRSTLPEGWRGTNLAADIHVAPSGSVLYVSNRGHNSVAVFSVSTRAGAVALEQTVSTAGDWPRNFSLDPTGRWLVVANQRSGSINVLARDPHTGHLAPTDQRLDVPAPSCVRFRASVGVTT